ncbi:hypothetical protein TWF694_010715 [Orbilia ellipsospora]|uniref:Uncharacterized protein n=1 Tax=Orbilia ellipsospora TaxID=2528407 RepID=A0AAV9X6U1_9PEZI
MFMCIDEKKPIATRTGIRKNDFGKDGVLRSHPAIRHASFHPQFRYLGADGFTQHAGKFKRGGKTRGRVKGKTAKQIPACSNVPFNSVRRSGERPSLGNFLAVDVLHRRPAAPMPGAYDMAASNSPRR